MKKEITSEEQFKLIKDNLAQAESAVKRVPISTIGVDAATLAAGKIIVGGNPVSVSPQFFTKLGSMLKVNKGLTTDMINRGDTKVAASLINGLRDYQSANRKDSDIMLIANVGRKEIVDICEPSRYRRITNDTLFDVTERILNDNPHLTVETVDYNPGNGRASINLLNQEEIGFAKAGKDEFFKFGFSIVQGTKDTMVESYNQRLVCTNGLRVSLGEGAIGGNRDIKFEDRFRLGGTSAEEIRIFLNKIDAMRKAGFVPGGFEQSIMRAVNTKASLFEVQKSLKQAISKLEEPDQELKDRYKFAIGEKYFHVAKDTEARLVRKGVDPGSLSPRQKQFIKTSMTIWDVVNSMTFLGSNNSGYPIENKHELKYSAGELFAKGVKDGYDLEFAQYASL